MKIDWKYIWRRLRTPRSWFPRVYPTGKKISKFINDSLDAGHKPIKIDEYCVRLNGKEIWIKNYPYGYGRLYGMQYENRYLPDWKTTFRLYDVIEGLGLYEEPKIEEEDIC